MSRDRPAPSAARVASSVVSIRVTEADSGPMGGGGEGSGIVVDKTHVLTNYHVVQGSNRFRVDFR